VRQEKNSTTKELARHRRNQIARISTTKHAKSTKEENIFFRFDTLSYPIFVSFATFVVRKSFVEWCISDNRPRGKFAQAAKPFNYIIREFIIKNIRAIRRLRDLGGENIFGQVLHALPG